MGTHISKTGTPATHSLKAADYGSGAPQQVLRRRLQRERAVLLSGDGRMVTPVPDGAKGGDSLDRAILGADHELILVMKARRWEALRSVNGALLRLGTRRYGVCEDCSNRIPAKRLRVRPDATRCVQCQARHETVMGRGESLPRPNTVRR